MIETLENADLIRLAKLDLGQYKEAQSDIRHHAFAIDELRTRAQRITKPLDPNKVQVQSANNGPEDLLCEIADMCAEHRRMQKAAEELCIAIGVRIGNLHSHEHQRILRSYWLYGQSLEQIAVMEHRSYRTIKRKHKEALLLYAQKLAPDVPL